jgi:hypothetical protein
MPNEKESGCGVFEIKFGDRLVEYSDAGGRLTFSLEPETGGKTLVLSHHAPRRGRPANYDIAYARSKAFLENSGYTVKVAGTADMPVLMTESDVNEIVRSHSGWPVVLEISWMEAPRLEWFRSGQGPDWAMWTVAVARGGPGDHHKIVFDELTRKFGVVDAGNCFLGFWGSLRETAEAVCLAKRT